MLGWPVCCEEIGETVEHVVGPKLAGHDNGQASTRELVDHGKHAETPPVLGAILHEVVGPRTTSGQAGCFLARKNFVVIKVE